MPAQSVLPGRLRLLASALAVAALAAVALAATPAALRPSSGSHAALYVGAAAVGVCLVYLAWQADPAWGISGTLALTMFAAAPSSIHTAYRAALGVTLLGLAVGAYRRYIAMDAAERPPLRFTWQHFVLVVVSGFAACSAMWSGTLTTKLGFFSLVDRLGFLPFMAYFLAPVLVGTKRQRSILLKVLVVIGFYMGLTAAFEQFAHALVWPRYILDPHIGAQFVSGRSRGPFLGSDDFGLALFEAGTACAVARATWKHRTARWVAGIAVVLCLAGTFFTLTRAVWAGSAVGVVVAMLAVPKLRRWVVPGVLVAAIGLAAVLAVSSTVASKASARSNDESPIWDRLNTNRAALKALGEHPLVGIGWQQFVVQGKDYLRIAKTYPLTGANLEVHNVFLSRLVELGLVGGGLWILAFVLIIGGAIASRAPPEIEPWRIGLIAVATQWVIVAMFGPLAYPFPNMMIWMWAGLVAIHVRPWARWHRVAPPVGRPVIPPQPQPQAQPVGAA